MLTEQAVVEKIEKIIEDNRELLNRDLSVIVEDSYTCIIRGMVIIRLDDLYWVLEKERPKFRCEKTRGEK